MRVSGGEGFVKDEGLGVVVGGRGFRVPDSDITPQARGAARGAARRVSGSGGAGRARGGDTSAAAGPGDPGSDITPSP